MHRSTDSTSDEEPIASMKPKRKKKTKMKTKSVTINNLPSNEAIAGTSTASTNIQSASKTSTAATANTIVPGDVANMHSPKKKQNKETSNKDCITHLSQSKSQERSR
jgi:hypothetical protein